MSFNFEIAEDDMDLDYRPAEGSYSEAVQASTAAPGQRQAVAGAQHELEDLLSSLPPRISYSSIVVPLDAASGSAPRQARIARRDLFDARFQMLSSNDDDESESKPAPKQTEEQGAVAGTDSDLIPGVYEGGLKTWECSIDLVASIDAHIAALEQQGSSAWEWLREKAVLELGCGTAIPSAYLLQRIFAHPAPSSPPARQTTLQVCDFNSEVLKLVTLPNLLLAWYFSPAGASVRQETSLDAEPQGDVEIDEEVLAAFRASLAAFNLVLRFNSGPWEAIDVASLPYSVVLSSETIYELASLPTLLRALKGACRDETLCLVAAKVLYFGVGGGVNAFEEAMRLTNGWTKAIRRHTAGVGRVVLSCGFS